MLIYKFNSTDFLFVFVVLFSLPISTGGIIAAGDGRRHQNEANEQQRHQTSTPADHPSENIADYGRPAAEGNGNDSTSEDRSFSFSHDSAVMPNFWQNPQNVVARSDPKVHPMFQQPNYSLSQNLIQNSQNQSANANAKGTLETFYKEIEGTLELYRQRDNSGEYIKFRLIDKKTNQTKCQWVVPKPNENLTLFFNGNQSAPFYFDETGAMIDEGAFKDPTRPNSLTTRAFDHRQIEKLSKYQINALIANSSPPAPIFTENAIPKSYPSENIYEWHKMHLPVHPLMLKLGKKFKVGETDTAGATAEFDQITERLDDGQNWIEIEVQQGDGRAKFVRNLFGCPPGLREPMVLFFHGAKQHFDWNGTAMSDKAFHYWRTSLLGVQTKKEAEEEAKAKWAKLAPRGEHWIDFEWLQHHLVLF
uniref:Uncharacterized protein n=1 Tax=Globodera rostochiensis TaxID=31243 RepID=A0A914HVD3_GLORO